MVLLDNCASSALHGTKLCVALQTVQACRLPEALQPIEYALRYSCSAYGEATPADVMSGVAVIESPLKRFCLLSNCAGFVVRVQLLIPVAESENTAGHA